MASPGIARRGVARLGDAVHRTVSPSRHTAAIRGGCSLVRDSMAMQRCAWPGRARRGTADTPHPFAGAAVCYGPAGRGVARLSRARQTRRASSGARKSALVMHSRPRRCVVRFGCDGQCSAPHAAHSRECAEVGRAGFCHARRVDTKPDWALLGAADTQRPAMAVAVCSDMQGRARRGGARRSNQHPANHRKAL